MFCYGRASYAHVGRGWVPYLAITLAKQLCLLLDAAASWLTALHHAEHGNAGPLGVQTRGTPPRVRALDVRLAFEGWLPDRAVLAGSGVLAPSSPTVF